MKEIYINDLTVRDGNQSLMATRMPLEDVLSLVEKLDKVGFRALEVWGGAINDVCLRYLDEDPWDRLRSIKKKAPNTKLQMLVRGQNLVGYTHYADDVVDKFIEKAHKNGIDIFRVFDALNDLRNIQAVVDAIKKHGGHCQCAIAYTTSPVHSIEYFVDIAKQMDKMGADSIVIKDMAGIITPSDCRDLVAALKKVTKLDINVHSHATAGIVNVTMKEAMEAGATIFDGCISPFSQGASHPADETLFTIAEELGYKVKYDHHAFDEAYELALALSNKYMDDGLLPAKALSINPKILEYQLPGGMLSNLLSQLKQQNASDKYEDVLKEIPKVRADLGYPPLVTPLSQMVGTQATMNVLRGKRYSMVSNEIKDLVLGKYGKTPGEMNPKIVKDIAGDNEIITCRPADLIAPQFEDAKKDLKSKGFKRVTDEQVLNYIFMPNFTTALMEKQSGEKEPDNQPVSNDGVQSFNIYVKE